MNIPSIWMHWEGGSVFNPFKKKDAEANEKERVRKEKQEERRKRAQQRGQKPIK